MNGGFYGPHPELRATVSSRAGVVMTRWSAGAASPGGPGASQIRTRKLAAVLDLTIERHSADGITIATDVLVSDAFLGKDSELAYEELIAWASGLGYQRVWLGHEVVALAPTLLGGTWESTCRHCGCTWSDSTTGFWLTARAAGFFPLECSLCSHPLTQPVTRSIGRAKNAAPATRTGFDVGDGVIFTGEAATEDRMGSERRVI
jgi:hypothetical protein